MKKKDNNIKKKVYSEPYKNGGYLQVTYFINADKKIIVCKMEPRTTTSIKKDCYTYEDNINNDFLLFCTRFKLSFIGKAACVAPDEFNEDFGKKIAYDRAMLKYLDFKKRYIKKIIQNIDNCRNVLFKAITSISLKEDTVNTRLDKKIKETK